MTKSIFFKYSTLSLGLLSVCLTSCAKQVSKEEFDEYVNQVQTKELTQIESDYVAYGEGLFYSESKKEFKDVTMSESVHASSTYSEGKWTTDTDQYSPVEFVMNYQLKTYQNLINEYSFEPDKINYFIKPFKITYNHYEEDNESEIKTTITQNFTFEFADFGYISIYKIETKQTQDLTGIVEGYGKISCSNTALITVSYK